MSGDSSSRAVPYPVRVYRFNSQTERRKKSLIFRSNQRLVGGYVFQDQAKVKAVRKPVTNYFRIPSMPGTMKTPFLVCQCFDQARDSLYFTPCY
ncbi:alpha-2-macroglobulin-like protein [Plakobranchus ocellatus]|uniref:Alpha-2-macroglobulin-like protein n=1 Tax=Plakobranchus ocellatus TaxID=259542 RepID=A0AAV3ZTN0_9GAST|nr:alpha-2-macroglobulin-like protein [Plakobranchus ocellatus]